MTTSLSKLQMLAALAGVGISGLPAGLQQHIPGTRARAAYKHRNRSKTYPFSSTKQHSKMAKQYSVLLNTGHICMQTRSTRDMRMIAEQERQMNAGYA